MSLPLSCAWWATSAHGWKTSESITPRASRPQKRPTRNREPMLEVVANALRSPSSRLIENCCRPYQNEKGEWGYCLTVWDAGHYHMISVSHTNETPTPEDVAEALVLPTRYVKEDGRYMSKKMVATPIAAARWATMQPCKAADTGTWFQSQICCNPTINSGGSKESAN